MKDTMFIERKKTESKASDVFIILFCLGGIAASLYFFCIDLFDTFRKLNLTPAGSVVVRHNIVQRRLSGKTVWDRLFSESPVYSGDLIRAARMSGALLNIEGAFIELGENTLIRVQKDSNRPLLIDFFSGEINVAAGGEAVRLSIGGRVVEALPESVFYAALAEDGNALHVTEGNARITHNGQVSFVPSGVIVTQDAQGNEIRRPMSDAGERPPLLPLPPPPRFAAPAFLSPPHEEVVKPEVFDEPYDLADAPEAAQNAAQDAAQDAHNPPFADLSRLEVTIIPPLAEFPPPPPGLPRQRTPAIRTP